MHPDHAEYYKYMGRARFDKAVNTISGILRGISLDGRFDQAEYALIKSWLNENIEFRDRHPFTELYSVFDTCLEDGCLDSDELGDLLWVCDKLQSKEYFDQVTSDIQQLHGILGGIAADDIITDVEISNLSQWLSDNDHLRGCWPYDEIDSLLTSITVDKHVDASEQRIFLQFCSDFLPATGNRSITRLPTLENGSIKGLCSVCPEITFQNSIFGFTGTSGKYLRKDLVRLVEALSGSYSKYVTQELDYLVIGADSNPCWAYACYGRKVEQAVELRKQGFKLFLVHEYDFLDAVYSEPMGEALLKELANK